MPTMRIVPTQFVRYWVPALDELKHGAARFGRRVERAAVDQLTLKRGKETLAHCVIVAVTDGTHGWAYAGVTTVFSECERCVLAALVRVVDNFDGVPLPERHPVTQS